MSQTSVNTSEEMLEKIANLLVIEVPQNQIANVCGLTEGRISQIVASEPFKVKLQEVATERYEDQQLLNQGWDAVEEKALGYVLEAMKVRPDKEFALKVAITANKASRRGALNPDPIPSGQAGVRSVIQLQATYVENLQQNFQLEDKRATHHANRERKQNNMMDVAEVEQLMQTESNKANELIDLPKMNFGD